MMNITRHTTHATTLTVDGEPKTLHTQVLDRDHLLEKAQARLEEARRRVAVAEAQRAPRNRRAQLAAKGAAR